MFGTMRWTLAAMVVGAGMMFAAGCESSGDKHADHHDMSASASMGERQAVMCEKCNVTWVKSPVANDKGRVIAYKTKKSHECPDCRTAVQNFFKSGEMKHACATCGEDALQKCEAHM
jgi:hypothetical protein